MPAFKKPKRLFQLEQPFSGWAERPFKNRRLHRERSAKEKPGAENCSGLSSAGVREVTRTPDLPLRRRSLYPTELRRRLKNGQRKRFFYYIRNRRARQAKALPPMAHSSMFQNFFPLQSRRQPEQPPAHPPVPQQPLPERRRIIAATAHIKQAATRPTTTQS